MPVPPSRITPPARLLVALVAVVALVAPACDLIIAPSDPPPTAPPRTGDDPSDTDPPTPGPGHRQARDPRGGRAGRRLRPPPSRAGQGHRAGPLVAAGGRRRPYLRHRPHLLLVHQGVPDLARVVARLGGSHPDGVVGPGQHLAGRRRRLRRPHPHPSPVRCETSTRRCSSGGWPRWTATRRRHWPRARPSSPRRGATCTTLFEQEGADNVAFVWCPNSWTYDVSPALASLWYPGGDTVDWVCADGYNWAPARGDRGRRSSRSSRASTAGRSTTGKPIMIGEFGAQERAPGEKAAWIRAIGPTLRDRLPGGEGDRLLRREQGRERHELRLAPRRHAPPATPPGTTSSTTRTSTRSNSTGDVATRLPRRRCAADCSGQRSVRGAAVLVVVLRGGAAGAVEHDAEEACRPRPGSARRRRRPAPRWSRPPRRPS